MSGSNIHLSNGFGDLILNQSILSPVSHTLNRVADFQWDNHLMAL